MGCSQARDIKLLKPDPTLLTITYLCMIRVAMAHALWYLGPVCGERDSEPIAIEIESKTAHNS
jgi:hypothetical protein